MSSKAQRLETLRALGGNVPETFPSLDAFAETRHDPDALWWIRATAEQPAERYRMRQGPWTTREVNEHAGADGESVPAACAVQRYLDPDLSGVIYVASDWVLTAAIRGSCRPLLREGSPGTLFAQRGQEHWVSGGAEMPGNAQQAIQALKETVGAMNHNILVEWIVTADDAIHHVDYKEIAGELMPPPFPQPDAIAVGNRQETEPTELVDSTRIEHLSSSGELQNLRCHSGSPLAHLCIEVAMRGGRVVVERSPDG